MYRAVGHDIYKFELTSQLLEQQCRAYEVRVRDNMKDGVGLSWHQRCFSVVTLHRALGVAYPFII